MSDSSVTNNIIPPVRKNFDEHYEIEKKLKKYLQESFSTDRTFKYSRDISDSKLRIAVEYPDINETPDFVPHIVISNISTSNNPNATLFHNFFRDVKDENGNILYEEQLYFLRYSVTMFCVAGNSSLCKDLSTKLQRKLSVTDVYYISDIMNLNIEGDVVKGPATLRQQFPVKMYESAVQFSGTMCCMYRRKYGNTDFITDVPLTDITVKVEDFNEQ